MEIFSSPDYGAENMCFQMESVVVTIGLQVRATVFQIC